jgi:hypothetical protein
MTEEDGAGARWRIFTLEPPPPALYKKGETPLHTHNTHNTQHLAQGAPPLFLSLALE